jgi:hypothetical protein
MYTSIVQLFSGELDPTVPQLILIGGSIAGGALVGLGVILEAHKIFSLPTLSVIIGVVLEAACTLLLFEFDEGISRAQQSKIVAMQARSWTKDQFSALQALKGKVTDIGVFPERDCLNAGCSPGILLWHCTLLALSSTETTI